MLIALSQIFIFGLGLGFTGPCIVFCLPVILSLVPGLKQDYKKSLIDLLLFFGGRLSAYILLGLLCGISAMALRRFIDARFVAYLNPLAGVISIGLGIAALFNRGDRHPECKKSPMKSGVSGGFFALGFTIGVSPCAPLIALLLEIALIAKNWLQGALYGFSFGLGTFVSGAIVAAGLTGLLSWAPGKPLKSKTGKTIFNTVCALLLILFGLWLVTGHKL